MFLLLGWAFIGIIDVVLLLLVCTIVFVIEMSIHWFDTCYAESSVMRLCRHIRRLRDLLLASPVLLGTCAKNPSLSWWVNLIFWVNFPDHVHGHIQVGIEKDFFLSFIDMISVVLALFQGNMQLATNKNWFDSTMGHRHIVRHDWWFDIYCDVVRWCLKAAITCELCCMSWDPCVGFHWWHVSAMNTSMNLAHNIVCHLSSCVVSFFLEIQGALLISREHLLKWECSLKMKSCKQANAEWQRGVPKEQ